MMSERAGQERAAPRLDARLPRHGVEQADGGDPPIRDPQIGGTMAMNIGVADQHGTIMGDCSAPPQAAFSPVATDSPRYRPRPRAALRP